MELTIRINDEDYERLTTEQKNGISAVLGLSGSTGCACHSVTEDQAKPVAEKSKRTTRKTKKEASDNNNTTDAPNNINNGRTGMSPETNDNTNDPVSSNRSGSVKEPTASADEAKSVEPVVESATQEAEPADAVEPEKATEPVAEVPSITVIQQAGAKYITANPGKVAEFQKLFAEFGIQKISDLASISDKIPQFVEALRTKGVEI
nr:MAG TPA: HAM1 protein-like protein [Caudoviricetes sp.]